MAFHADELRRAAGPFDFPAVCLCDLCSYADAALRGHLDADAP